MILCFFEIMCNIPEGNVIYHTSWNKIMEVGITAGQLKGCVGKIMSRFSASQDIFLLEEYKFSYCKTSSEISGVYVYLT